MVARRIEFFDRISDIILFFSQGRVVTCMWISGECEVIARVNK
jgi:hypothetical protein